MLPYIIGHGNIYIKWKALEGDLFPRDFSPRMFFGQGNICPRGLLTMGNLDQGNVKMAMG